MFSRRMRRFTQTFFLRQSASFAGKCIFALQKYISPNYNFVIMEKIKITKKNAVILPLVALLMFNLTCFAQKKQFLDINYSKIEKFVKSEDNQFKQLMDRFEKGDTTLTTDELAIIYYGSFYSTDYTYTDASRTLRDKMKEKDFEGAFALCKEELKKSPASLDLLYKAATCAKQTGDSDDVYSERIVQILEVIFASGDGRSEKTAFKVVAVSDEYFIIYGVLGANLKEQALIGQCDRMTIYEDDAPDETFDLYFDVTLHLSQLDALFGGKPLSKPKKSGKKGKYRAGMVVG